MYINKMSDFKSMSKEDVLDWIEKNCGEEVATKCAGQQIDGLAIELLATKGTTTQFERCGLNTVGSQLKFPRLVISRLDAKNTSENPITIVVSCKKPSNKELKECSEVNKRVYNAKKEAVRAAAIKKWPGNNIPIFRKNKQETEQLDALVNELDDCIFEPVGFDKAAIRQHIIDIMNERRRSVRNGYDYTAVDRRTLKRKAVNKWDREKTSSHDESSSLEDSNNPQSHDDSETQNADDSETQNADDSETQNPENFETQNPDNSETQNPEDFQTQQNSRTDHFPTLPSFFDKTGNSKGCQRENELSLEDCRIIVTVAFGAIKYSDVPRSWTSLLKKYMHSIPTTLSKDNAIRKLAPELIDRKIVEVTSEPGDCISRCMVKRLQKL